MRDVIPGERVEENIKDGDMTVMKRMIKMTHAYRIILVLLLAGYLQAFGPDPVSAAAPVMPDFTPLPGIADRNVTPVDVATDAQGNIYVADNRRDRVVIYTPSGRVRALLPTVSSPVCLAVADNGTVYVGSKTDGSVTAYTSSGSFKLGKGTGEFSWPRDVQVDSAGNVYVADLGSNEVRVYGPGGGFVRSIGTPGAPGTVIGTSGYVKPGSTQGDGEHWNPRSLAINESASEIIVLDQQQVWDKDSANRAANGRFVYGAWVNGTRIQVFSLDGTFLRAYNIFGHTKDSGEISAPAQVAVDAVGRIYLSAPGNRNKVMVYGEDTSVTPSALVFLGAIDNSADPLFLPSGITISRTNILYVVNRFRSEKIFGVQAFGLGDFSAAVVTPSPLAYEAIVAGANPAARSVTVENPGTVDVTWTAATDTPWVNLSATTGTVAPGATSVPLDITVDITGMQPGSYSGLITFSTDSGLADQVEVRLEVKENPLTVTPQTITLNSQVGKTPTAQDITIDSTAGELSWEAGADVSWITLHPASGVTPAPVTLTVDTTGMAEGIYNAVVTIGQAGSNPCPVTVNVTLVLDPADTVVETTPTLPEIGTAGMDINGTFWKVDPLQVPQGLNLNGVWGRDDDQLVIVGDQGFAVRMDDDGFKSVETTVTESLRAVWGTEKKSYYAVGDQGSIIGCREGECEVLCATGEPMTDIWGTVRVEKVSDAHKKHGKEKKKKKGKKEKKTRKTYQVLTTGALGTVADAATCGVNVALGAELRSSWADRFDHVYAVGDAGRMFVFDGSDWTSENINTSNALNAVWGRNRNDIFVVGDAGVVYHNDGSGWTGMNSGTFENLYGVWGAEEGVVYAVGDRGTVLAYENGAWSTVMTGGTDTVLRDVWTSDDNVVVAVGDNGTVLTGIGPHGD